jgi:hypothetical protein
MIHFGLGEAQHGLKLWAQGDDRGNVKTRRQFIDQNRRSPSSLVI